MRYFIERNSEMQRLVTESTFVVAFLAVLLMCSCGPLLSDSDLSKNYFAHRSTLERLRTMAEEDHVEGRIGKDYCDPRIPAERLRHYRELMREASVVRVVGNGEGRPLEFTVDANGWLDVGDYKGNEYTAAAPHDQSDSLNESCFITAKPATESQLCSASKALGNGWYMMRYEYR
jgi:hypothetical protein